MKLIRKQLFLLFAFLLIGISVFAQIRLGIKAGLNIANMQYESQNQINGNPSVHSLTSFNAGFIADIPIIQGLALQPGLMLGGKGSKLEYSGSSWKFTDKTNPLYLEVPVNVLFKPIIGKNIKLYFGLGPYIAYGIGGKVSVSGNVGNFTGYSDHTLKFGNSTNDDLKSTDLGGNVLAGFEFSNGLLVGAQYSISFTNIAPNSSTNNSKSLRNKVLSFSAGYLFGK